jgi:hypothetical protein
VPGVRPVVCDCASKPGSPLWLRKIHLSSIERFSFVAPCLVSRLHCLVRWPCSWVGCNKVRWRLLHSVEGFYGVGRTATLCCMDSVRFGRALGVGARVAAKTLATAVDAATSPNPSATEKTKQATEAAPAAAGKAESSRVRQQAAKTTAQVRQTSAGLKEGSKRFRESVGGPLARLSVALWLELTGVFFGIFAVFAVGGAWKLRGALNGTGPNHDAHGRFLAAVLMAAVFAYFCVSSFVKANRRSQRR